MIPGMKPGMPQVAAIAVVLLAQSTAPSRRFEAVQTDLFSAGGTLVNAAADYDGDGDIDLFVGFNGAANRLYRNDRGVFADAGAAAGLADARPTRAAAWGDFDGDGDSDLLVGFAPLDAARGGPVDAAQGRPGAASVLRLYRNDRGRFTDVTAASGLSVSAGAVRQPAWVDVDADGDLDLFVGFRDRADMLLRNTAGSFVDIAPQVGLADSRKTVGAVWFDYDEDGDLDLYAAHMDGQANGLYRNDGGRFADVAEPAGVAWGGRAPGDPANGTVRPCAADFDGDGRFDLFTANYGPNGLFLNRGETFEDVSAAWGAAIDSRYDTCAPGDFDNDGRIDLYVNGTVTGGKSYRDYLFRNTGTRFEDVTPDNIRSLEGDHGALWADFDGDGAEDLALTGAQPNGMHLVLRNLLPAVEARQSLDVRVVDGRRRATRAGAEVRVYSAGTRRLIGARLVDSGSGYDAQNDMPVRVGLGQVGRVDVEVTWPAGGRRVVARVRGVAARAVHTIVLK
jgi:VCBS repeat protein/ASPIC/UnbV protein